MTVRITVERNANARHIRVEGRLDGEAWDELEQLIGGDASRACLELSGLRSADARALAGLHRLRGQGVKLRDVPPHLAWRIDEAGS